MTNSGAHFRFCAAAKIWITPADREWVQTQGLFGGWTTTVTMVWFLGSAGGLIVAGCMKYADNVLKGFATSISTVIITAVCILIPAFSFSPTPAFVLGAIMVLGSAYSYGRTIGSSAEPSAGRKSLKASAGTPMAGCVDGMPPGLMRLLAAGVIAVNLVVWLFSAGDSDGYANPVLKEADGAWGHASTDSGRAG